MSCYTDDTAVVVRIISLFKTYYSKWAKCSFLYNRKYIQVSKQLNTSLRGISLTVCTPYSLKQCNSTNLQTTLIWIGPIAALFEEMVWLKCDTEKKSKYDENFECEEDHINGCQDEWRTQHRNTFLQRNETNLINSKSLFLNKFSFTQWERPQWHENHE